ncbi:hypothetical protein [Fimbriiglobus ruber]|uniref:DUF4351 domain-containing protein n=1 Tax=Fimbriiglobus ruber TaxID=1908690 RepID=A0A225DV41_9BACT|nr:hypothetical protein [Fimbriiglobus ruber]OWK45390.1 hypothetical protein FRUB_01721 [Fimbriiglobus ruber]
MSGKAFDATVKALVEVAPESWPAFAGVPGGPTEAIDSDIATVSGAADKVLRVHTEPPYLLHLEFVAGHDAAQLPVKLHVRNGLLDDKHNLLVRTVAILLHPEANSPQLTGTHTRRFAGEDSYLEFRYRVIRVWELPPELFLTGGPALLPLAPISAVTKRELPGIIKQMVDHINAYKESGLVPMLESAAYVLSGLRYPPDVCKKLFRGMTAMRESSTYQAILAEGREEGREKGREEGIVALQNTLHSLGQNKFGRPDTRALQTIREIHDLARLQELCAHVATVGSWDELLAAPAPKSRRKKRT